MAVTCLLLAAFFCAVGETAAAQSKAVTSTSLAITLGGNAVKSVATGSVVTLTAQVKAAAGAAVTPGQVNFCDASAKTCTDIHLLGTAQLTAAGTATLKLRPGIGSNSYKAVFLGTSGYAGSASGTSTVMVTGLRATTTAIAQDGYAGNYTLTATVAGIGNLSSLAAPTGKVSFIDTSNGNAVLANAELGSGTAELSFFNSSTVALTQEANAVAAADFNGDGIPDLAVSDSNSGQTSLAILLGSGDGTFKPAAQSPAVGLYPDSIAVGDFNGDGIPDLAVTSVDQSLLTILLGKGDGTFTASPQLSTGSVPQSVTEADFNGDGIPDLAVVNANSILILLGKGDGTFTETPNSLPTGMSPITVVAGDFNGDGIADLAVVNNCGPAYPCDNNAGTVGIFLGKGDGSFTATPVSPTTGPGPVGLAVGDFNGDGFLDLAVSDYDGDRDNAVTILLGRGDGTFGTAAFYPAAGLNFRSVVVGDFNGDGIADLAVGEFWHGIFSVLIGKGDGTFSPGTAFDANSQLGSGYVGTADFNGDGIPDLALPSQDGSVPILLSQPSETVTAMVDGISTVGAGPQLVEASYLGDSNYSPSVSGTVALTSVLKPVTITPAGGTFSSTQTVTMTESIPGATIYYDAYGVYNTSGFVPYTGPIALSTGGQETITAYATETGYDQSDYTTVSFTLNFPVAPTPVISPSGGVFAGSQTVSITDSASAATVYYTTDGTWPTINSAVYTGPIKVTTSGTVAAIAASGGYSSSLPTSAPFFIQSSQSRLIYTVAGSGLWGFAGDGGSATHAALNNVTNTAVDAAGNLYIADTGNQVVRKVDAASGTISTIAGTGIAGYRGDGGAATGAQLYAPYALALDSAGNLYISDSENSVVRRVDAGTGTITTVAGTGTSGYSSDGGLATKTMLGYPRGIALDKAGNLYIGDGARVRKVTASTGAISTVAGTGSWGFSGDGGPATSASLTFVEGIAFDKFGNLYIADTENAAIRKVAASTGFITTVAGQGGYNNWGFSGDGGPATSAKLNSPQGVAIDSAGNLYIADTYNYVLREVTAADGIIHTISGHPNRCTTLSGDGEPAAESALCFAPGVAVDGQDNVYVAEEGFDRIRKITAALAPPSNTTAKPTFSVAAGTYTAAQTLRINETTPGAEIFVTVNGDPAIPVGQGYYGPIGISGSATIGAVAVAPGYLPSDPVSAAYAITTPPKTIISTFAGNGTTAATGSGGPATDAGLGYPTGVAADAAGNLYIADQNNLVVWMVSAATGKISVAAGIPNVPGLPSPSGPATSTGLASPRQVAVDKAGNLYISDNSFREVLKVDANTGLMTVYAGGGNSSPSLGDGGPATQATLVPDGLAFDQAGNLYIVDGGDGRIREVSAATGNITTVAGGVANGLGDGGPATSATLNNPGSIAVDSKGNFYIGEQDAGRVRVVDAQTGIITTFAGNGNPGMTGDGGPATAAEVFPAGLAVDSQDNLYISNLVDGIRMVPAGGGAITRVVGIGYSGLGGDGEAPGMAQLCAPAALSFDKAGTLYIADSCNFRVRRVGAPAPAATPVFSLPAGTYTDAQSVAITDSTKGAAVYYTTDGSEPTTGSNLYSAPLTVSSSETLKAIAVATGYAESAVASADYVITKAAPDVSAVKSSANPSMAGDSVTFTASVTSTVGSPSGTVTFMDGAAQLGTATLSNGSASYATSALTAGSHAITAVYGGDGNFASVTSAALTQVVESFSIAPSSGSSSTATASPGGKAVYTLAVTPPAVGDALTFSVTGVPVRASATFSPATVAAGAGVTTVTLTIALPASAAARPGAQPWRRGAWPLALGLLLLPLARRLRRASRSLLSLLLLMAAWLTIGVGVSACGGSSTHTPPPPQKYSLTITAASGTLTQSTTLTLLIQQ